MSEPSRRTAAIIAGVVCLALVGLPLLYTRGLGAAAVQNGDEAIYVEMAREMIAQKQPSELRWDGEAIFPRPPAAIWVLAAAYEVEGESPVERPLRLVNATLCAVEVALTIVLGVMLFSPLVGLVAGGLLAVADLFVGYARVYESEPLLGCFVLLAFIGWAGARKRPRWWILFGTALGGALLTKQLVGFLPVLAPLVAWLVEKDERPRIRRGFLVGIGTALIVAAPWHVLMIARHGSAFVDSFFLRSLVGRAKSGLLHHTTPLFYVNELTRSEGVLAYFWLAAATLAIIAGTWKRNARTLLVGAWALGVLGIYSLSRSRYDYYLLLAYPAFALCAAWLIERLPVRGPVRLAFAAIMIISAAAANLPRNLTTAHGEDETRALLVAARGVSPGAPLYTFNTFPYAARVYSDRPARVFVDLPGDLASADELRKTGMPAPAELASPPTEALRLAKRPSLLLLPRARLDVLAGATSFELLGESLHYRLLLLP